MNPFKLEHALTKGNRQDVAIIEEIMDGEISYGKLVLGFSGHQEVTLHRLQPILFSWAIRFCLTDKK